jgi:hypothetical protein
MTKPREGEFWDLTFGLDPKAEKVKTRYVQTWAGVESVFTDEGQEEMVWLPRRKLGPRREVETTTEAAIALAEKDGEASGLPRWMEPKP